MVYTQTLFLLARVFRKFLFVRFRQQLFEFFEVGSAFARDGGQQLVVDWDDFRKVVIQRGLKLFD